MNTKVHLDLPDLLCACAFNPNTGRGPHTVIKKLWIELVDYSSFQAAQVQASQITTGEQTIYMQSPDELDVVCDILGMSKESFLGEVEQCSEQSRAAVTARQGKYIETCYDYHGQTKGFSKRQLEMCIRNKFQPRWAGKHKRMGKEMTRLAYNHRCECQHNHRCECQHMWFIPQTQGDERTMNIKRDISIEGSSITLVVHATLDCCSSNGKVVGKTKFEMHGEEMSDLWRGPDHAAALCMGAMAPNHPRFFPADAQSFIAEYFLDDGAYTRMLSVERRSVPFQRGLHGEPLLDGIDVNNSGRIVITQYTQDQCRKFWELVKLRAKLFVHVVQRLINDKEWQQSYFCSADQDAWFRTHSAFLLNQ